MMLRINYLKTALTILCFQFSILLCNAQAFSGDTGIVSDDGMVNYFNLQVTGVVPATMDTSFGVVSLCINVSHTWDDDLVIWLKSPDNTLVELTSHNGGGDDNYFNTCFTMDASTSITNGAPPYTGIYLPEGNLGDFNNGQNPNGLWQLVIVDEYPYADFGDLHHWVLSFSHDAAAPATPILSSSNLPIVTINTNGQLITDPVRITAQMGIIDNGPGLSNHLTDLPNNYSGFISIEKRGSSSITFAQPSYSFETEDSSGSNLDASLLGMPEENDWVLNGPYDDKSMMRNALIYRLSNDLGRYASRTRFCEVMLNDSYQGVYLLEEKIKQDSGRVHIANLSASDTSGDQLTGGYILKIDKFDGEQVGYFTSQYPPCDDPSVTQEIYFQYHDPPPDNIVWQQQNYIHAYIDSFEDALAGADFSNAQTGFRKYADEFSFIDFSLLNEISKNVDGYRWSTYLYKDKASKNGKVTMGPLWDFNLAFGNADYYNGAYTDGWEWDFPCPFPDGGLNPFWWHRLLEDSIYYQNLKCRWHDLRTSVFDLNHINAIIDSFATLLDSAKDRHFTKYPILGVYVWPNAYYPPTYAEEIDTLKSWIAARVAWMDQQLQGSCTTTAILEEQENNEGLNIYPNPASTSSVLSVSIYLKNAGSAQMVLNDLSGRTVEFFFEGTLSSGQHSFEWNPQQLHLSSGCYVLTVKNSGRTISKKIFLF